MSLLGGDLPHRQVGQAGEFVLDAAPPDGHGRPVGVERHAFGAATGLGQAPLVRLAHFDPLHQLTGEVVLPEVGFVGIGQALGELQRPAVRVVRHPQGEGQQAHQQPLLGFGGVQRQRQRVIGVQRAVHVRDLQLGLVDGGFEGQEVLLLGGWPEGLLARILGPATWQARMA